MERQKNTQTIIIGVLAVAVLMMSVGFAATAYTQNLNINGSNATIKAAKWSVHFDEDASKYAESTGSVAATTHSVTGTTFTFDVTLAKPGDFYEATVHAVNDGTFNAALQSITMGGVSAEQAKFVSYSITYNNGTTYTATNDSITGITLPATNGDHPVKVRVEYLQPADENDLPTTADVPLTLTATLNYEQAD